MVHKTQEEINIKNYDACHIIGHINMQLLNNHSYSYNSSDLLLYKKHILLDNGGPLS